MNINTGEHLYSRCKRCNKPLTTYKTKLRGYGDRCWHIYNMELKKNGNTLLDTISPDNKK